MKVCDHTSVGMLVWRDDKLLLIERKKFPFGFAPPAGHVDEDGSYEEAAKRELKEEVGLDLVTSKLIAKGIKNTSCHRIEGTYHDWKIYAVNVEGDVKIKIDEVKNAKWYSKDEIKKLSYLTEKYQRHEVSDEDWERSPGIEMVWYDWFKELHIL